MPKSLFDDSEMDIAIGLKEKKKEIPSLLPTDEINTNSYSDNKPQIFTKEENKSITDSTPAQMSGAFFIKDGHLVTDIRLEFNVENKLYGLYMKRLQNFVKECEEVHVLKSSSGI